jgi:hypothetical protein
MNCQHIDITEALYDERDLYAQVSKLKGENADLKRLLNEARDTIAQLKAELKGRTEPSICMHPECFLVADWRVDQEGVIFKTSADYCSTHVARNLNRTGRTQVVSRIKQPGMPL